MEKDDHGISEELLAFVGKTVSKLLTVDNTLQTHEITEALHRLREEATDVETRHKCLEIIQMIMKKMH
ncbi:hypothetical protein [Kalamiella sp. sgz302252]|uniref:hypothetical protein n=1 Tax=Pantoea sp. sgz302252 TaxID=3341827 RepID=UPI0036D42AC1